jgi:hypothetical protein
MKPSEIAIILGAMVLFFATEAHNRPDSQEWSMRRAGDKVSLTLDVRRTKGWGRNHWRNTTELPWQALRGITSEQLDRILSGVKFDILRDPGTLHCEGRSGLGRASGTFTFEPNQAFSSQLTALGYSAPTDEQLFSMLMHDVTLAFARRASEAGLQASTKDLIDMRAHGVNEDYMERALAAGYTGLTARNLIDFRNHGVTPDFLRELKASGYSFSAKEIVDLRNHGVTADFVESVKAAGYAGIEARELVDLRNHGVDAGYMRGLKSHGLSPEPREIVDMKNHGIDPDYLRALKEAGYENLATRDVIDLKNHGVPAKMLREAKDLGFDFTIREIIELRNNGVDGAYLRKVKDSGFANLTADKIVRLRQHGID